MNTVQCTCSSNSAIEEGLEVIQTRGDYCCIKKVHNSSHNFLFYLLPQLAHQYIILANYSSLSSKM